MTSSRSGLKGLPNAYRACIIVVQCSVYKGVREYVGFVRTRGAYAAVQLGAVPATAEMSVSSGAAPPGHGFEELAREQTERLAELRTQLARTRDTLDAVIQVHAQLEGLLAENRGGVAAAATELESSPGDASGSVWDRRRLALRPLPVAAMTRLSHPAYREWFTRFGVPFQSSFRRRFTEDDWLLSSSDDESDKPCRSSAPYKQLSRAARTIQAGLRPRITRKVKKARFVRAYMTLVHATHGKLTRHVLVHCAAFLIGPHAPPYRDTSM